MILLKNGIYIDWKTLEIRDGDILVEEGPAGGATFVSAVDTLDTKPAVIDCKGKFITRSFANGHHHAYSALARGMPPPAKNPENFREILQYVWWNLDKALDLDMIRSSALITAMACAKNGVTFVIDHHASPCSVQGSLETIAEAFEEVGVGHLLCYEISDRDGMEIVQRGLEETSAYLAARQGLVGLHASFTVSDNTLRQAVSLAEKFHSGIHIHVAEDISDQEHCVDHYRKRVAERLYDAGALKFPRTILAHCLHLDEHERSLVKGSPAWVVQNMESNLNNSVGFFSSAGLGPRIMLGTDGMNSDMLRSAKSAFFTGHNFDAIDYPETYRRFRNVHHYLNSGGFTGDGDNNLVVLDYDSPTPLTQGNFYGHFLFGMESRHVSHVLCQGKLIVKEGNVTTIDEQAVLGEALNQTRRLWERL